MKLRYVSNGNMGVDCGWRTVVKHHINYKACLPFNARFGQRLQVVCRSKLFIELGDINDSVTTVWVTIWRPTVIVVLVDSADPNGDEAH